MDEARILWVPISVPVPSPEVRLADAVTYPPPASSGDTLTAAPPGGWPVDDRLASDALDAWLQRHPSTRHMIRTGSCSSGASLKKWATVTEGHLSLRHRRPITAPPLKQGSASTPHLCERSGGPQRAKSVSLVDLYLTSASIDEAAAPEAQKECSEAAEMKEVFLGDAPNAYVPVVWTSGMGVTRHHSVWMRRDKKLARRPSHLACGTMPPVIEDDVKTVCAVLEVADDVPTKAIEVGGPEDKMPSESATTTTFDIDVPIMDGPSPSQTSSDDTLNAQFLSLLDFTSPPEASLTPSQVTQQALLCQSLLACSHGKMRRRGLTLQAQVLISQVAIVCVERLALLSALFASADRSRPRRKRKDRKRTLCNVAAPLKSDKNSGTAAKAKPAANPTMTEEKGEKERLWSRWKQMWQRCRLPRFRFWRKRAPGPPLATATHIHNKMLASKVPIFSPAKRDRPASVILRAPPTPTRPIRESASRLPPGRTPQRASTTLSKGALLLGSSGLGLGPSDRLLFFDRHLTPAQVATVLAIYLAAIDGRQDPEQPLPDALLTLLTSLKLAGVDEARGSTQRPRSMLMMSREEGSGPEEVASTDERLRSFDWTRLIHLAAQSALP